MRRSTRLLAAGVVAGMSLALAACGSSSGSTDSGSSTPGATSTASNADADKLLSYLGLTKEDVAKVQGQEFKIGAVLPLSGGSGVFGKDQIAGMQLAVEQMNSLLGANVVLDAKDHKSGDPQAAASAARELASEGTGTMAASFIAVFGSLIEPAQKYKMLMFDAGGGTGNGFKGTDYYYGLRANVPDDSFYALKWFAEKQPEAKKVALVVWDAGQGFYDPIEANLKDRAAENGFEYTGKILSKVGATDFSAAVSKLKDMDADIVFLGIWGDDTGLFMKQYVESGGTAQVVGPEYVPATADVAGPAFDKYWFAQDFFPVSSPPNAWSQFFVDSYRAKYGEDPATYYAANYYETAFTQFALAVRVAKEGGDINSGEALQNALKADPSFPSLYGGDASTVGRLDLDATTHDPKVRPVGLFSDGGDKQYAAWNIGGSEFTILD